MFQIRIEFATAIAAGLSIVIFLVYCLWLIYTKNRGDFDMYEGMKEQQCPFCTSMFVIPGKTDLLQCPHCHSLLSPDERADHRYV